MSNTAIPLEFSVTDPVGDCPAASRCSPQRAASPSAGSQRVQACWLASPM